MPPIDHDLDFGLFRRPMKACQMGAFMLNNVRLPHNCRIILESHPECNVASWKLTSGASHREIPFSLTVEASEMASDPAISVERWVATCCIAASPTLGRSGLKEMAPWNSPDYHFSLLNITGWWFQTFFIFHNIWDNPSHWLIFYRGVETTNQTSKPQ